MPTSPASTRTACIDLPALPLQLVLHDHPKWRSLPVAIVEEDRPQAKLLWVNEHARQSRILPGMRFGAARSLASKLRAEVMASARIEEAMGELFAGLHQFSPRVEPCATTARASTAATTFGFWVDSGGLDRLYGGLEQWSSTVYDWLRLRGFEAAVIVGFHRWRTHAIARVHRGCWVIPSPRREAQMAASVPLDRLDLAPVLRDQLHLLAVQTLGEFMALPAPELRLRFGAEAEAFHHRFSDDHWAPLRPRELVEPLVTRLELDYPERRHGPLLRILAPMLDGLVKQLASRSEALSALRVELHLDHAGVHREQLEPAGPTLDTHQLLELIRLRLESRILPAGVDELRIEVEGIRADVRQLALFRARSRRDLEAGGRALARLRAAFGASAVTKAKLLDAHLPEASFTWVSCDSLRFPKLPAREASEGFPLVRTLLNRPLPLPNRNRTEPEGWHLDPRQGPVVRMHGPYRISGGWWVRTVERDYYYVETKRGDLMWIFYDRPRRRWYLHGRVQ